MQRFLIPLVVCLAIGAPSMLLSQEAQSISVPPGHFVYPPNTANTNPDFICNLAGTFSLVQFLGESNDTDLPQIFLCAGDSFLVRHNGDAILTGDPQINTPPGIAFAYYACPPTVIGDNLQAIGTIPGPGDPCVLQVPPPANGLYITPGVANGGDTWFYNNGGNIATFGLGQPISIFYAPITLDEITPPSGFESAFVGGAPGPCVNVNTNAAFEVIYLNPITQEGVDPTFGDDCIGKFTIRGGYPEYSNTAIYTITIALTGNPSVKAVIHTQQSQLFHLAPVIFSVPQSGNYTITVEDGKSCPAVFTMDMTACDPSNNITLTFPNTVAPPATSNFCVPLTVENFDIVSGSFSINWDPTILQYTGISDLNPILDPFSGSTLNASNASLGQIGLIIYDLDNLGNVLSLPDNATLFSVCFDIVGALGQCSGLNITNNPSAVAFEDATGISLALTVDTGSVCIQYLPLDIQIDIIDTTCVGTATIKVTAFGGESPYNVIIHKFAPTSGSSPSGNIIGSGSMFTLVGGVGDASNTLLSYSVCVTDSSGFGITVCDTIDVYIPTLGAQIDFVQEPSCNGDDNGIVNAVVLVGGVAVANPGTNYTYQWTPATLPDPTTPLQDGTVNGGVFSANYTLVVTDTVKHCSSNPAQGFLGQPTPISEDTIIVMKASCSGVADGSISYLVEGGTPFTGNQYQYVWQDENGNPVGGGGQSNPVVLNNLFAGEYKVTITDMNGCTKVDSVTVDDFRQITINQGVVANVSCFGLNDGGATVTVSESVISGNQFNFTWSPTPAPPCTPFGTNLSSAYNCLAAGNYFVTAQDVAGCKDTLTIHITEPAKLVLDTLGLQNPGCAQLNSGSISVVAQGGNGGPNYGPNAYAWNIPAFGPSQSGLAVGIYTVTITDTKGCKDSLTIELTPPGPLAFTVDPIPVKCGADGSLIAVAPTAVQFNWTAVPAAGSIGSSDTLSGLQGGTYAVTVTDAFSCSAVDTVMLASVVPLAIVDTSFVLPLCFGDDDGSITVTAQDGQTPYSYNWAPGPQSNSATIFGLKSGLYTVTVTDIVGCTATSSFTLNTPPQVLNTLSGTQDVSCFGICDGTAQVATNYATTPPTAGNFLYIWSDGNNTTGMRTDLCAGTFTVVSADGNGCGDTTTFNINGPLEITGVADTFPASCFGLADGSATVTPAGGNGAPYTYLWAPPSNSSSQTANNLPKGEYTVTITDSNGCSAVVDSIYITEPAQIVVSSDPTQTAAPECAGTATGIIVLEITGGNTGQFQYEWSDAVGVISHSPVELDSLPTGDYTVVVTDSEGCTGSLSITLMDPDGLQGSYIEPEPLICNGDVTTLEIADIFGGSGGPYQFSLDDGALLDVNFPVSLSGGEHYITYWDANYCFVTDTIQVPEPAPIEVSFDPSVKEIELGDTTYQLKPLITGAAVDSFIWTPAEFLHYADTLNPYVYTFESQVYNLVVFDDKGCSGSGSVTINVDPNRNVYIPNIFRPGVGGLNDHFNVHLGRGVELVNYMRVYDRWGELMYTRERFLPDDYSYADGWDGKFNGDYVNPAVFVYIIEVKFLDGRVLLYRGDVTVIR